MKYYALAKTGWASVRVHDQILRFSEGRSGLRFTCDALRFT